MCQTSGPFSFLRTALFCTTCVATCVTGTFVCDAAESNRQWIVYIAQDKHLDYNWCGSTTEIELRMAALTDYYLEQAEQHGRRWNLDGTIWAEVYRRHRGDAGLQRLHGAIRDRRIGYAGNYAVLLWGILSTETAIRACYGAVPIERATGTDARTSLVMENPGLTWGAANILTECGFDFLGRGIYWLRAESYNRNREPYPLFWWTAPNGKRVLVRWDLYDGTQTWGGYAEAFRLAKVAGISPSAQRLQTIEGDTTPEVHAQRRAYIHQTVERYEAYGDAYPISSILLLGTGHDGWIRTDSFSKFIERFNNESDGTIRLVDARYQDFFEAAEREIQEKELTIPSLEGSFGICWEEWAAHLAGLTQDFREAERLLRLAEADHALKAVSGKVDPRTTELLQHGFQQLLVFAEHDMGGISRRLAAMSAGVRASAAVQALDIGRSLAPIPTPAPSPPASAFSPEDLTFSWQNGEVTFDEKRCAVVSLVDRDGRELVPSGKGPAFGEFVHTRYRTRARSQAVFPEPLDSPGQLTVRDVACRRSADGVEIRAAFDRNGFRVISDWFFHTAHPWIDVTYRMEDGWTDDPQTVQSCFPLTLDNPTYRYDAPGAVLVAGPKADGGDDLPGANPELFAGLTFASATDGERGVILLTPDTLLLQFGADAVRAPGYQTSDIPAQITSLPMMNLTGNDRQFGQAGRRQWTYRYRVVLVDGNRDALGPFQEAQRFATPPFLQVPGHSPAVPDLSTLEIDFAGGPLLTFKLAEDRNRLILRFWNVSSRPARGSLKLPKGWPRAERCDALERPQEPLTVADGRANFAADARGISTVALCR
ncbi:MAG: hypothetical protein H8E44_14570 [Planctomycetes bacterium]|nr:hypothetical protein [Planctomycetota bacterium]MBL7043736.1 hypothetical protein [Pirellulaceae bacterium]